MKCEKCKSFRIEIEKCDTDRETQYLQVPYCEKDRILFDKNYCKEFEEE